MKADPDSLLDLLQDLLADHPDGVKEYELLLLLREMGLPVFSDDRFSDSLTLFRAHFLLFHLLYTLRERLAQKHQGTIEIHCLKIILRPWQSHADMLPGRPDSLRNYYLDLTNLEEMKQTDVDKLIHDFWKCYLEYLQKPESYTALGLPPTSTREAIKHRYRELALEYHPDRGGSKEAFQKISTAASILLNDKLEPFTGGGYEPET